MVFKKENDTSIERTEGVVLALAASFLVCQVFARGLPNLGSRASSVSPKPRAGGLRDLKEKRHESSLKCPLL
jgi:hypothetical protein